VRFAACTTGGADALFAAAGRFSLGSLRPGGYVLQISAVTNDPQHPGRRRTAIQRMAFDVQ
jgi:hypothetical protein